MGKIQTKHKDGTEEGRDFETGRFLPGNRLWEARSSHGARPKFAESSSLLSACYEYFQWVEDNPLWERKVFHAQGDITREDVPKMRAMTIGGLCVFLDISFDTWAEWRKTRSDLSEVMGTVELIIKEQKFTGAAADLLNANIIARDLGLTDRQDVTSSDGSMSPRTVKDLTDDELMAIASGSTI